MPRAGQERAHGRSASRHSRRGGQGAQDRCGSDRPRRSGSQRHHSAHLRQGRPGHAAVIRAQRVERGTEEHHPPMGGRGCEVRGALGLCARGAARRARSHKAQSDRRIHSVTPRAGRARAVARGRPAHAHPPSLAGSDRSAAFAARGERVRRRHDARRI